TGRYCRISPMHPAPSGPSSWRVGLEGWNHRWGRPGAARHGATPPTGWSTQRILKRILWGNAARNAKAVGDRAGIGTSPRAAAGPGVRRMWGDQRRQDVPLTRPAWDLFSRTESAGEEEGYPLRSLGLLLPLVLDLRRHVLVVEDLGPRALLPGLLDLLYAFV